ncbi:MAG: hypothetical protein EZS26_000502 [Candidatus Ordinivivax streblomastigis]|uniref:Secretion system C-terminal sorting domain-containing protein n=1 Tax=Candidatus Ordinivivax streblomastigis TaxID=2540710 RepID=A0A5M8P481_9BACT|nr:MAG: hypothetical protein EZS26_000465 [Candidatus Ordinivivax streblomastigis]KAA6303342.1 MAG: hypothetical protein EZS26_000502 [Candidatus Ordinivivax streblomastigis]
MKKELLTVVFTLVVFCLSAQDTSENVPASGRVVRYTLRSTHVPECSENIYINIDDIATSIHKVTVESSVYPNPVDDRLNVPLHPESGKKSLVLLLDVNGKLLQKKTFATDVESGQLSLSGYDSGIYLVQVIDSQKTIHRIIKK